MAEALAINNTLTTLDLQVRFVYFWTIQSRNWRFYWNSTLPCECWISIKSSISRLLCSKINKSHLQIQCCQCIVDCQCFCHVLCSFNSNFIALWMLNFNKIVNFKINCSKNKQISPPNSMLSMCCWLSMLLPCSLLLHLQFYCSVNVEFQ